MSIERQCKCGKSEGIRFNFVDEESEAEFHSREYICEATKRKETPVFSGVINYFPEAIKEVARVSFAGNEQHNPGTPLHWDRSKSGDELDALSRHLIDAGSLDSDGLRHSAKVAWRALANLQKEIERELQEEYEESIIAKSKEDDIMYGEYKYDGEECDGELGSHPLCSTDYCPCKEEEIEKRMNVIGQNGNDGLHYDEVLNINGASVTVSRNISDYPESNWTENRTDEV